MNKTNVVLMDVTIDLLMNRGLEDIPNFNINEQIASKKHIGEGNVYLLIEDI